MATESTVTRSLLTYIRKNLPQAVVIKHSDQFTAGIPDFSISLNGITSWYEIKIVRRAVKRIEKISDLRKRCISGPQAITMSRLSYEATAFFIIFFNKQMTIWHPNTIGSNQHSELEVRVPFNTEFIPYSDVMQHGVGRFDRPQIIEFIKKIHKQR